MTPDELEFIFITTPYPKRVFHSLSLKDARLAKKQLEKAGACVDIYETQRY
jgi:hypothetical protein